MKRSIKERQRKNTERTQMEIWRSTLKQPLPQASLPKGSWRQPDNKPRWRKNGTKI